MEFKLKLRDLGMAAFLALILILTSCKKSPVDSPEPSGYRVTAERFYTDGVSRGELLFKYTGNKISNWEYNGGEGMNFTYPDNFTIVYNQYGNGADNYTGKFKLSGDKVTEIIMDNEEKAAYSYNAEGKVTSIKYYDYTNNSWVMYGEDTFTYTSGKLVQIYCSIPGDRDDKYVFSYNGEEINSIIYSYRESGGLWVDYSKNEYNYLNGKVSKINIYYKSNGIWDESNGYEEFFYDSDGNLTEKNNSHFDQTKYIYEEGKGNFRQLFEFFEDGDVEIDWTWQYLIPMPTKSGSSITNLKRAGRYNIFR